MMDDIEKHNADPTQSYKLGLNKFSHLTFEEFLEAVRIGGTRSPYRRRNKSSIKHAAPVVASALPKSVDWSKFAVTAVKDQGNCGSCWAFSAVGALESAYLLAYLTGNSSLTVQAFSEQQIVSCDVNGKDAGCTGGSVDDAFQFVHKNGKDL
jgi:KDEL-tailed cysteine endopeptidase